MKGIHARRNRALFSCILLLSILFTANSHAAFTAYFEWGEGQPGGVGVTALEACSDLNVKVAAWLGEPPQAVESIVNSPDEVLFPCGDGWLTFNYPACLFITIGEPVALGYPQCHYLAEVREVDSPVTYTIEIVPTDGNLTMVAPAGTGGNSVLNLTAIVRDQNNLIIPGITVRLEVDVLSNSGGHDHENVARHTNHAGTLSGTPVALNTVTGVTGPNGFDFTLSAPAVSGDHTILATCEDVTCNANSLDNIVVGIDNLSPLGAGNWVLIGSVPNHLNNHYLTNESTNRVTNLANNYNNIYSRLLYLNDASLVRGGLFDIRANWSPSHLEHRKGTVIDVRANNNTGAIPPANWDVFQLLVRLQNGTSILETFHDSLTGEELVANRHFHVRLEGRSE